VGDHVRLQKLKSKFGRGYTNTFTTEIFHITKVIDHLPIPMYEVHDLEGNLIEGNLYAEQLSLIHPTGSLFNVEKIVRSRWRNGIKENLIKWEGYPSQFNTWERAPDQNPSE